MTEQGSENRVINGLADPAARGDERTTLVGFLQRQRGLVEWKLAGVSDDAIRGLGTPSGLTAHGLVLHLTNTERSWFRQVFADQADLAFDWSEDDRDGDWRPGPSQTMAALLADYRAECEACDSVIAGSSLDAVAVNRPFSLRWIILHMIEETARHVGHADLLREQADGTVGEDPL